MVELDCPGCGHHLRIGNQFAGKEGRCRYCKTPFFVPMETTETPHDLKQSSQPVPHIPNESDPLPGVSALAPGKEAALENSIFAATPKGNNPVPTPIEPVAPIKPVEVNEVDESEYAQAPADTADSSRIAPSPHLPKAYKPKKQGCVCCASALILGFIGTLIGILFIGAVITSPEFQSEMDYDQFEETLLELQEMNDENFDNPEFQALEGADEFIEERTSNLQDLEEMSAEMDEATSKAVTAYLSKINALTAEFTEAQEAFDQTDIFTFDTLKQSGQIQSKEEIVNRYVNASNAILEFMEETGNFMVKQLEESGLLAPQIADFMEGFVKPINATKEKTTELYTLHSEYGSTISDILSFLRTKEWTYNPQEEYPNFASPKAQTSFDKKIEHLIEVEDNFYQRMPILTKLLLNSQSKPIPHTKEAK